MDKQAVINILDEISILLQLDGDNPFKARAYTNAALALKESEASLRDLLENQQLKDIPGIGKTLQQTIVEIYETGVSQFHQELKSRIPSSLLDILQIPGLGIKKVQKLYQDLGIENIGELEYACVENRLLDLKGFGVKSQNTILEGIQQLKRFQESFYYSEALVEAKKILKEALKSDFALKGAIGGCLRRGYETVKSIEILICSAMPLDFADHLSRLSSLENITLKEKNILKGQSLDQGISVTIVIVDQQNWGNKLLEITGSAEHLKQLTALKSQQELPPCQSEKECYAYFDLPLIAPELREGHNELELALNNQLPQLIIQKDLQGFFHVHTDYSDGITSLEQIAAYADQLGLKYLGIADHSKAAFYANGLSEKDLKKQSRAIDKINQQSKVHLFKGIEVDILKDGSLDYSDEILAKLDFVIASVHSNFKMNESEMTNRIIKAMSNPHVNMLGHPSGRLLLAREPYKVNMMSIIKAAQKYQVMLEINANPYRLDLDWHWAKIAKMHNVMLVINPDAHNLSGFADVKYGVKIARKAFLSKEDILNTRNLSTVKEFLKL